MEHQGLFLFIQLSCIWVNQQVFQSQFYLFLTQLIPCSYHVSIFPHCFFELCNSIFLCICYPSSLFYLLSIYYITQLHHLYLNLKNICTLYHLCFFLMLQLICQSICVLKVTQLSIFDLEYCLNKKPENTHTPQLNLQAKEVVYHSQYN